MPRKKSENRVKAHDIYDLYKGNITNREIANQLGISEKIVAAWKSKDQWDYDQSTTIKNDKSTTIKQSTTKNKRGGQPGNQNAKGKNLRNQNARKHGLYSKWLPPAILEIIGEMPKDPLDVIWHNIEIQWANILYSQKILYAKSGEAWRQQVESLTAGSRAISELDRLIASYYKILDRRTDTASDYQVERIRFMEAQRKKLEIDTDDNEPNESDGFVEALQSVDIGDWTDEEV